MDTDQLSQLDVFLKRAIRIKTKAPASRPLSPVNKYIQTLAVVVHFDGNKTKASRHLFEGDPSQTKSINRHIKQLETLRFRVGHSSFYSAVEVVELSRKKQLPKEFKNYFNQVFTFTNSQLKKIGH